MTDYGNRTENLVQEICRQGFLADFVVRSPKFSTKAGQRREVADLLLPLRNAIVAIQIRSREISDDFSASDEKEMGRLVRRVDHAVNQVKTVRRALEKGTITHWENLRGIRLPVRVGEIKRTVGVVVIDLVGTLAPTPDQQVAIYNGIGSVSGIPVHVFIRQDFETVVEELDTIPDFLSYLDVRRQLMERRILAPITPELDFLAVYQTDYPAVKDCLAGRITGLLVQPGLWNDLKAQRSVDFERRAERRRLGRTIVDRIIEAVHTSIGYAYDGSQPGSVESYVDIATALAELRRVERNFLGTKIREKLARADHDPKGFSYFAHRSNECRTVLLFLCSREDRKQRRETLDCLTSAAYLQHGVRRAVGVATENLSVQGRSFDFRYIEDETFQNEAELRTLAGQLFGPAQYVSEDEWGQEPPAE